jgi:hypothetical protein
MRCRNLEPFELLSGFAAFYIPHANKKGLTIVSPEFINQLQAVFSRLAT